MKYLLYLMLALPIFPGRRQPSIFGAGELNCRVRDGNGWTLTAISTNFFDASFLTSPISTGFHQLKPYLIVTHFPSLVKRNGDPWESRTPVCGVRGRRLDHLTNGPYRLLAISSGAPP